MFSYLARATVDLMLLRRGPQDLPAQKNLLLAVIAVFVLVSALAYVSVMQMGPAVSIMQAISSLAYLAGFVWIVLSFSGKKARFPQSFMAFVLTGTVFNILEIGPLHSLLPYFEQMQEVMLKAQTMGGQVDPADMEGLQVPVVPMMLLLLGYVWRLIVMAHIFHHTLEVSRGRAMAITLIFPTMILFLALMLR